MTSSAHHRDPQRCERVAKRCWFPSAEHDTDLWKCETQGAEKLCKITIIKGMGRLEGSGGGTKPRQADRDLGGPADTLKMEEVGYQGRRFPTPFGETEKDTDS